MTESKNDKKELNINYDEEFKPEIKDSEDYKLLNKVYEENLSKVEEKIMV